MDAEIQGRFRALGLSVRGVTGYGKSSRNRREHLKMRNRVHPKIIRREAGAQ